MWVLGGVGNCSQKFFCVLACKILSKEQSWVIEVTIDAGQITCLLITPFSKEWAVSSSLVFPLGQADCIFWAWSLCWGKDETGILQTWSLNGGKEDTVSSKRGDSSLTRIKLHLPGIICNLGKEQIYHQMWFSLWSKNHTASYIHGLYCEVMSSLNLSAQSLLWDKGHIASSRHWSLWTV